MQVLLASRPAVGPKRPATPQALLQEAFQMGGLLTDDLDADQVQGVLGKQQVTGVVAARRRYLAPILDGFQRAGLRPYLVEPAPAAALRVAARRGGRASKGPASVRVLLGAGTGLAALVRGDLPVAWKVFPLPDRGAAAAIFSGCWTLWTFARQLGIEVPTGSLVIHGRPDLGELIDWPEWLKLPMPAARLAGPDLDEATVAEGLAIGCQPDVESFNLARHLRPRPTVLKAFPTGQAVALVLALAGATMLLEQRASEARGELDLLHGEFAAYDWAEDLDAVALRNEKTELTNRTEAVRDYLESRILWSACLAEIAEGLPATMRIGGLQGFGEAAAKGRRGASGKRRLAMDVEAPIPEGGAVPREIDIFLDDLRNGDRVRDALPNVSMGPLRWDRGEGRQAEPHASFTILCLPGESAAPARKPH